MSSGKCSFKFIGPKYGLQYQTILNFQPPLPLNGKETPSTWKNSQLWTLSLTIFPLSRTKYCVFSYSVTLLIFCGHFLLFHIFCVHILCFSAYKYTFFFLFCFFFFCTSLIFVKNYTIFVKNCVVFHYLVTMLNTKPRCTLIIGHAIDKIFNQCTR